MGALTSVLVFFVFACSSSSPEQVRKPTATGSERSQTVGPTESVPAPDYSFDTSGLVLVCDADTRVVEANGAVYLSAGSVTAQSYAVVTLDRSTPVSPSYLESIGAEFHPLEDSSVPAEAMKLVGERLSTWPSRSVVLRNRIGAVDGYQVIHVDLHPPTGEGVSTP